MVLLNFENYYIRFDMLWNILQIRDNMFSQNLEINKTTKNQGLMKPVNRETTQNVSVIEKNNQRLSN